MRCVRSEAEGGKFALPVMYLTGAQLHSPKLLSQHLSPELDTGGLKTMVDLLNHVDVFSLPFSTISGLDGGIWVGWRDMSLRAVHRALLQAPTVMDPTTGHLRMVI